MPLAEIIPTIVPSSLESINAFARDVSKFAKTLHIDICDGVFAPNKTWMPHEGELLPQHPGFTYEAHLMVSDAAHVGAKLFEAGATRLIGHIEAAGDDASALLENWKKAGAREVGLAILFDTPLSMLEPHIPECDVVQLMSIRSIGMQGIPYAPETLDRVHDLRAKYPRLLIADDGGVSPSNIADLARAGVRRFCVGSALSQNPAPAAAYQELLALAKSAVE